MLPDIYMQWHVNISSTSYHMPAEVKENLKPTKEKRGLKRKSYFMLNSEVAVPSCRSRPSCLKVVHCSTAGVTPALSRAVVHVDRICDVKAICTTAHSGTDRPYQIKISMAMNKWVQ